MTQLRDRMLEELERHVWVAVGTVLTNCPPLRSPRAALPHKALVSDEWRRSELVATDEGHAVAGAIDPPIGAFASSSGDVSGRDDARFVAIAESLEHGIHGGFRGYLVPRGS